MEFNEETIEGRIRSRLHAVRKTANGASTEAGSPSLIPNILNGRSRNPRIDTLERVARVLETSASWLFDGTGPRVVPTGVASDRPADDQAEPEVVLADVQVPLIGEMPRNLPVYGTARGSLVDGVEGIDVFSTMAVDYVRRPPALMNVPDAYAIFVNGDSMEPEHPHGALRMVHPHRPVSPGDSVIVQTKHWDHAPSQHYIKKYRRKSADRIVLEQLNPPARIEIPMKFVVAMHKVMDMNDLFGV